MLDLESHMGLINISVGATNLVWGITWDGNALVRNHVTKDRIYGKNYDYS